MRSLVELAHSGQWAGCATVVLAMVLGGCQFDPSGGRRLGSEGDASPGEADGDVGCPEWSPATPFVPCEIEDRGGALVLDQDGTYAYDTALGELRFKGELLSHASELIDGGAIRLVSTARFVLGRDAVLRVTGEWPLLLVSFSTIELDGVLDLSSTERDGAGAGANPAMCPSAWLDGGADTSGSGGGGGGFGTPGGPGGDGSGTPGLAGEAGPADPAVALHGGCPGGAGGRPPAAVARPPGGSGGGGVALSARIQVSVAGTVEAGGAGGAGGGDDGSGGGGGGSGGLIWLDAPSIALTDKAILASNGGGGGEGGDNNQAGDAGAPGTTGNAARGGGGGANDGGDGGDGVAEESLEGEAGKKGGGAFGGGGGGGGGGGRIRLDGRTDDQGARITPTPPLEGVASTAR